MAGSASAIRAGRAYVELGTQDDALKAGLDKAKRMLQTWGASIAAVGSKMIGLGAAIVTPMVGASMAFGQMGTSLSRMSERTGISVEELSTLGFAAEQSGVDTEQLAHSLAHLARVASSAAGGSHEAAQALAMLHLSAADLVNLTPDQQLLKIADAIAAIGNPTQKAAAAMAVFGRSGAQMLPLLNQGAAGLAEFRRQAEAAGLAWSGEDATAAVKLTQATNLLTASFHKMVAVIGGAVAPLLVDFANWVTPIVKSVADWVKANPGLAKSLFQVGLAIAGIGAVLAIVGPVLIGAGAVIGTIAAGIESGVIPALAIGAAIGYVAYKTGLAGWALEKLGKEFGDVKDTAVTAWGGIVDAVKAGDIALAAQIAFKGVELAWMQTSGRLKVAWSQLKFEFIDVISNMVLSSKLLTTVFMEWNNLLGKLLNKVGLLSDEDMAKHEAAAAQVMALNDEQRKELHLRIRGKAADDMANERAAIDAEIARLKAELDKLRNQARPYDFVGPIFQKTKPAIATPFQMMAHGDAEGTFSAAAAGRMGFGHSLAERTAKATEEAVDLLGEINGKVGGGQFA